MTSRLPLGRLALPGLSTRELRLVLDLLRSRLLKLVCLKVRELRECLVAARFVIMEALLTFLGLQVEEVRK